jgi:hypothetical protein
VVDLGVAGDVVVAVFVVVDVTDDDDVDGVVFVSIFFRLPALNVIGLSTPLKMSKMVVSSS